MRVVLDTSIVVSGLLQAQGNPAQVLALVLSGAIQACHDKHVLAEYAEVLARMASRWMRAASPTWICPTGMMNRSWPSRWRSRRTIW